VNFDLVVQIYTIDSPPLSVVADEIIVGSNDRSR
jgi:hypothetical protein